MMAIIFNCKYSLILPEAGGFFLDFQRLFHCDTLPLQKNRRGKRMEISN